MFTTITGGILQVHISMIVISLQHTFENATKVSNQNLVKSIFILNFFLVLAQSMIGIII